MTQHGQDGFYNALMARPKTSTITAISTFIVRPERINLKAEALIPVEYDRLVASANMQAIGLDPKDFYIDPSGFLLNIFNYDAAEFSECAIEAPMQINYLRGIRFYKPQAYQTQQIKAFGQFLPTAEAQAPTKVYMSIGHSMKPYATIEKLSNGFMLISSKGDERPFIKFADLEKAIEELACMHQNSSQFFESRKRHIKEVLPSYF